MLKLTLKERLTPALIKALEDRTLTNDQVADRLGVNPSYLSTVFNTLSKKAPGKVREERKQMSKLVKSRKQIRIREAKKVLRGTRTLAQAAENAGCSERTMRRYVEQVAPNEPDEAYE